MEMPSCSATSPATLLLIFDEDPCRFPSHALIIRWWRAQRRPDRNSAVSGEKLRQGQVPLLPIGPVQLHGHNVLVIPPYLV